MPPFISVATTLAGKKFGFPREAVAQKFAFVGKSGSGKTYGVGRFVEELYDKTAQVIIVDPVGNWWGVRLAADGKSPGLSIPVLGGMHGDTPLHPSSGAPVAQYLARHKISAVIDVSQFTRGEQRRFVEAFAREFFEAKKRSPSAVMIIWEESQFFVPQRVGPAEAPMVGAMETLIKVGRNYGVGTTLLGQRPQSINKDVLNQTEVFVCYQLTGPHERKAVADWMSDVGVRPDEDFADIPKLKTGSAFVWSPSWLEVFEKVKFLPKRTYDFSKTPDFADYAADIDVQVPATAIALAELSAAIEEALGDGTGEKDVKVLQKRVRALTAEVKELRERPSTAAPILPPKIQLVEVPVLTPEEISAIKLASSLLSEAVAKVVKVGGEVSRSLEVVGQKLSAAATGPQPQGRVTATVYTPTPAPAAQNRQPPPVIRKSPRGLGDKQDDDGDTKLKTCPRAILVALAQAGGEASDSRLSAISGYRITSSTFGIGVSRLHVLGLVQGPPERRTLTEAGWRRAGDVPPLPKGRELYQHWCGRLRRCPRKMFEVIYEEKKVTRKLLSEKTGYRETSSTFGIGISNLRTLNLVHGDNGGDLSIDEVFLQ